VPQLAELALGVQGAEIVAALLPERAALVRPQSMSCERAVFEGDELNDYIEALGLGRTVRSKPVSSCSGKFEEAKNFGSLIQPLAWMNEAWPLVRVCHRTKDLGRSSSCARRTSKSCAVLAKPRRSPSGITSSCQSAVIWVQGDEFSVKRFLETQLKLTNLIFFAAFIVRLSNQLVFLTVSLGFHVAHFVLECSSRA